MHKNMIAVTGEYPAEIQRPRFEVQALTRGEKTALSSGVVLHVNDRVEGREYDCHVADFIPDGLVLSVPGNLPFILKAYGATLIEAAMNLDIGSRALSDSVYNAA